MACTINTWLNLLSVRTPTAILSWPSLPRFWSQTHHLSREQILSSLWEARGAAVWPGKAGERTGRSTCFFFGSLTICPFSCPTCTSVVWRGLVSQFPRLPRDPQQVNLLLLTSAFPDGFVYLTRGSSPSRLPKFYSHLWSKLCKCYFRVWWDNASRNLRIGDSKIFRKQ
jgi:hypothetical protein